MRGLGDSDPRISHNDGSLATMISTKPLLLAGTAFLMLAAAAPAARAGTGDKGIVLAQASPHEGESEKKNEPKPPQTGAAQPRHEAQPPQHQPPKPAQAQQKPPEAKPPQQQAQPKPPVHKPPEEKPAARQQHEAPKAAQQQPQPKTEMQHEGERPRETGRKPEARPTNTAQPSSAAKPAAAEQKPEQKPAAAEQKPPQQPTAQQDKETKPSAAKPAEPQPSASQAKPSANQPAAQTNAPQKPSAQSAPSAQPPAGNAHTSPSPNRNAQTAAPAAVAPPAKPQSAQQFILPKNGKPTVTLQDVRKERHERREGNRTVITEGNRTIVKQDNRVIIRHNEAQRFAVGARNVNVERHGNETTTVVVRPNGVRIINVTDERGHLIRRVRRDRNGHEVVIIDERSVGPRRDIFVNLPPPVIRIPRDRYIVEVDRARPETIYEVLDAPPVQRIEQRYTIDQVRYSAPLRERMPRLDLDIHFDTGSWQLTPDQIDKLSMVAQGLNRAIDRNPHEVFMIEGHTDAVGSAEDNLSLSDRRAESVAVALTEQFQVPPENLVTQGYGEQDLKVQTEGASRANRRVSIRRITPLIDRQAAR
jgi:outer membrane protein OmpA-like peptidoglycan-associated protein